MKKYFITAAIGLLLAFAIAFDRGIFNATDAAQIYLILSDACFVPGAVLGCIGILLLVSNKGAFHGISFGIKSVIASLSRHGLEGERESFYEYSERKSGKEIRIGHFLLIGGIMIALGVLFAALI